MPVVGTMSYLLPNNEGLETVYLRFANSAGILCGATSASITYVDNGPVINSVSASPAMVAAGDNVQITAVMVDSVGVAWVSANGVYIDEGPDGYTWTATLPADPALGAHSVDLAAMDLNFQTSYASTSYTTADVLGANGKSAIRPPIDSLCQQFLFKFWGSVTEIIDSNSFVIDDGSGVDITVIAPGYENIYKGDCVSVRGILDPSAKPPTLTGTSQTVYKYLSGNTN